MTKNHVAQTAAVIVVRTMLLVMTLDLKCAELSFAMLFLEVLLSVLVLLPFLIFLVC